MSTSSVPGGGPLGRASRRIGVGAGVVLAGVLLLVPTAEVATEDPGSATPPVLAQRPADPPTAGPAAASLSPPSLPPAVPTDRSPPRGVPGPPGGEVTVEEPLAERWWALRSQRSVPAERPGPPAAATEPPGAAGAGSAPEADHLVVPAGAGQQERYDPGPPADPQPALRTAEGFDVVAGTAVRGQGPEVTYTVELEPGVDEDLLALAAVVEESLGDPRSWARDRTLRRVEEPAAADIRVVLATPATVDRLCGQVGLRTLGRYSCWNGTFAALNAWRWVEGADGFDDLTTYRRYLVNHEFGHGLGYGHVGCPAPGEPAPVMMQQSMGTGACTANGWPYPEASVE